MESGKYQYNLFVIQSTEGISSVSVSLAIARTFLRSNYRLFRKGFIDAQDDNSVLSPRFALALQFANEIHSTQVRKGLGAPYISHLMAVCALVLEYGGNETQAISALLHDSAEDCGGRPMLETVRVLFGDDVAKIVESCTDTFDNPKPAWRPRRRRTFSGDGWKACLGKACRLC